MEAWEWLAGVMRELGVCCLRQQPLLISARQAGAPWEWSPWWGQSPFPSPGCEGSGRRSGEMGGKGWGSCLCLLCLFWLKAPELE